MEDFSRPEIEIENGLGISDDDMALKVMADDIAYATQNSRRIAAEPPQVVAVIQLSKKLLSKLKKKHSNLKMESDEMIHPLIALESMVEEGDQIVIIYHGRVNNEDKPKLIPLAKKEGYQLPSDRSQIQLVTNMTQLGRILAEHAAVDSSDMAAKIAPATDASV